MTIAERRGATFRVGLISMRSGRTPAANLDAAAKLIAQAKADGADYVQTPEMTNIMEARREALMAAIVPEDEDPTLAGFRDLARRHRFDPRQTETRFLIDWQRSDCGAPEGCRGGRRLPC